MKNHIKYDAENKMQNYPIALYPIANYSKYALYPTQEKNVIHYFLKTLGICIFFFNGEQKPWLS